MVHPASPAMSGLVSNRRWLMAASIVLIILGVVAIIFPYATTIATKVMIGGLFLIGGVVMIGQYWTSERRFQSVLNLLLGILYVVVGGWLAFFPLTGIITLTVILLVTFVLHGLFELGFAWKIRPSEGWLWVAASGVLSIAAGTLIFAELPSSALWSIGLLVGINLLSSGVAYLLLAFALGRAMQ
ncbi:DUF308 domain-containing protein [Breoghania sp.]|uniref:HdeD family acid-resistance protein n=1 Tax=Breoghania sp. TaxID=2065378 RepID=UPI002AA6AFAE|nr:DUF308 domain-containing protein [Breoghania sp.]